MRSTSRHCKKLFDFRQRTALKKHLFWQRKAPEERRVHGVGFLVRNSLLPLIVMPSESSERMTCLSLPTSSGLVNIMRVYAPTICSSAEAKNELYDELETAIKRFLVREHLFLLGDFNARIGSDQKSWPRCIGHFGVGKLNENGQRLLELCSLHDFYIANTFCSVKPNNRVSW